MADDSINLGVADYLANPEQPVGPALKDSLTQAVTQNPDTTAKIRSYARDLGLPFPAAMGDPEYVQAQGRVMGLDPNGMVRTAPKTANWLAQPDNAAVAHDDVDVLKSIEQTVKNLGGIVKGSAYALGEVPYDAAQAVNEFIDPFGTMGLAQRRSLDPKTGTFKAEGAPTFVQATGARMRAEAQAAMPTTDNWMEAGVNSGVASLLQNAPGVILSLATKNPELGLALMSGQTGLQSYGEARDAGLDPAAALAHGAKQGAIEGLTEKLPMEALLKDLKAGSGVVKTWMHQMATDVPGEITATVMQNYNDWADLHPDKPFADYLAQLPGDVGATVIATAMGTAGHTAMEQVAHAAATHMDRAQVQQQQAQAATQTQQVLEGLTKAATASALRERDPQTFKEYVDAVTQDTPADRVYINAQDLVDVLAQGNPQKLAENADVLQAMPSVMPQLEDAVKTGGLVEIPISELLAFTPETSLGQAMMEHLKVDPEGMSVKEADEFLQTHKESFQSEVQKVMEAKGLADEFGRSADAVKQHVLDQLTTANRFTGDVNEAYASLTGAFYATQAARLNITPEELFAKHPVTIQAQGVAPDSLTDELHQDGNPPRMPSSNAFRPPTPTEEDMRQFSREEDVDLDKVRSGQTYRYWDQFNAGDHPGDLLDDYGDKPVAARREDGEYVILDGHHRTEKAMAEGTKSLPMHVIDVKSYAPDVAGRAPNNDVGMSNEELLRELGFEQPTNDFSARGAYNPATNTLVLLRNADLSTFLHEMGHFYLETLARLATDENAPEEIKADWRTAAKFIGADEDPATFLTTPVDGRREGHELFARGFEAYLREGKAPAMQLQGLFQRFKSWLMHVYQNLTQLKVELTPEVRGVMDRLLATDGDITRAEQARAYTPLFETKPDGMSDLEWGAYQRLGAEATADAQDQLQARSIRDMRWLQNTRARLIRELGAEAREKRKAMRAEVEAEALQEPVYAAQQFLKRGQVRGETAEGPHKLSLPDLRKMYGEAPTALEEATGQKSLPVDYRKLGFGRYGMLAEDGLHPDHVAELFGFSSGDELVRTLLTAEPLKERVEGVTDQRMLERYGDLTDQDAIAKAADEAIHNDARLRFVATEANALAKATGQRKLLAEAARDFARELIGRQRIRDVKPAKYTGAETRAAVASAKAAGKGDLVEAATQKRNQLINGYAAKAAYQAQQEVEAALRYFDRLNGEAARKGMDPDYRDQIDQLLERFDLRKGQSLKAIDKRKSLKAWIEAMQARGLDPILDDKLVNEAYRQHFRDLTVDELRGLVDAVKNIAHLGKLKNRLLVAAQGRAFQAVVDEAEAAIRDNAYQTKPDKIEHNTVGDRLLSGAAAFFAQHRKFASLIREMSGLKTEGGILWRAFIEPMNEANDREAGMRQAATRSLMEIFKPITTAGGLRAKLYIPEIGRSLSLEGRLAVALNWGNELNRARIMDGDKWTAEQAQAVVQTLTAEQLQFVNQLHEYLDSYWTQIAAKERRVTGVEPEKVGAEPYQVQSADGQLVDMRGGYYPIKYDTERSTRSEQDDIAEAVRASLRGVYTRATTRRGHTKARVEKVERPVRKDLSVPFQHVNQVIHDLAFHEYLIDANRLISAPPIDAAIRDHYGVQVLRTMRNTIDAIAEGDNVAENQLERVVNYIRTGTTVVGLGYNLLTALQQPLGLTQSIVRIGPKYMAHGMFRVAGDAVTLQNTMKEIAGKSEFMRLRSQTMMREIAEVQNQVKSKVGGELAEKFLGPAAGPIKGGMDAFQSGAFYLITKLQLVADVPTWLGAYAKAQDQGENEATAVRLADQAVRDSQGSGQTGDLAQIQRGSTWFKLWTSFYSFFNIGYNQMAESLAETRRVGPSRLPLFAADVALVAILPAVLGELMKRALRGDDWDWDELGPALIKNQLSYMLGFMVGARDLGQIITSDGKQAGGPASLRIFADSAKLYQQVRQGEMDDALRKAALNTAGILFHFPAAQINRTVDGMEAMAKGETTNPMALLLGPPQHHTR